MARTRTETGQSPLRRGESERLLTGWGRTAPSLSQVRSAASVDEVVEAIGAAGSRGILARGLGRSYGDAAQTGGGCVLDLSAMATITLDAERGLVTTRENPAHGRHQLLSLTDEGRSAFATLEANTKASAAPMAPSRRLCQHHPANACQGIGCAWLSRQSACTMIAMGKTKPSKTGIAQASQANAATQPRNTVGEDEGEEA